MPKILENRSSKTLPAANLVAIKSTVQTIVDNLIPLVVITDDDYKSLAKLGEVLKPICDLVLAVVEEAPSYLEDEQPVAEIQKDKIYYEQMAEILKLLSGVVFMVEHEMGTCGAEYRNAIHNYEGNVKAKVKKGSSAAQLILDKLNRIDRGEKAATPAPKVPVVA